MLKELPVYDLASPAKWLGPQPPKRARFTRSAGDRHSHGGIMPYCRGKQLQRWARLHPREDSAREQPPREPDRKTVEGEKCPAEEIIADRERMRRRNASCLQNLKTRLHKRPAASSSWTRYSTPKSAASGPLEMPDGLMPVDRLTFTIALLCGTRIYRKENGAEVTIRVLSKFSLARQVPCRWVQRRPALRHSQRSPGKLD